MKKKFFFILLIILIIIIVYYNNYNEHFSVKVQDAMIFKDYQDNLVGTYPDKNIYPDLFIKSKGEYVNLIGTVHGVSEIKMSKPNDGKKGPIGDRGLQGYRGPIGPDGKSGEDIVKEDVRNGNISMCYGKGGYVSSYLCKGIDGHSPKKPRDGTPGKSCEEVNSNLKIINNQCPQGDIGPSGKTCRQIYKYDKCPDGNKGTAGKTCQEVNSNLEIINNQCPQGDRGPSGRSCEKAYGHVNNKCPIQSDGTPGKTCYKKFGNTLPPCKPSNPGVNSVDCMNSNDHNVKTCGRVNPNEVLNVAKNLTIDSNTLSIDNNTSIELNGNINVGTNGRIILKDTNNKIIKIIDRSYIDSILSKSNQCKKCLSNEWNNSDNCKNDQGECIKCKQCNIGEYAQQPCSEHSNTQCKQCNPGYVGIGCSKKCDPKKGEIPKDDKTACKSIGSNKYIDPNDNTKEKNIPSNKYRNPNDARLLNNIPSDQYRDSNDPTLLFYCPVCSNTQYSSGSCGGGSSNSKSCHNCPECTNTQYSSGSCGGSSNSKSCHNCPVCSNTQYSSGSCGGSSNNKSCHNCPVCSDTQYSSGSCGGSSNSKSCHNCPCGKKVNSSKTGCDWDNNFYQFYNYNLGGGCSKISKHISGNFSGWNAVASSFLVPAGKSISVFNSKNYGGSCISHTAPGNARSTFNMPSSHNDNVQSIRINETCYRGRDYCHSSCGGGGACNWCGKGHKCCRQGWKEGSCSGNEGNAFDHVCVKGY